LPTAFAKNAIAILLGSANLRCLLGMWAFPPFFDQLETRIAVVAVVSVPAAC
jgi:hypothetical protein